jgi:hypothetical protein
MVHIKRRVEVERTTTILQSQLDHLRRSNVLLWHFMADFLQNRNKNAVVREPDYSAMMFRAEIPHQTYVVLWRTNQPEYPSIHTLEEIQHSPFPDTIRALGARLAALQTSTFSQEKGVSQKGVLPGLPGRCIQ